MVDFAMIDRPDHARQRLDLLADFPVVVGARQTGKTTLANRVGEAFARTGHCFDLGDPRDEARLDAPMSALEHLEGLGVIDESQRMPSQGDDPRDRACNEGTHRCTNI